MKKIIISACILFFPTVGYSDCELIKICDLNYGLFKTNCKIQKRERFAVAASADCGSHLSNHVK